MALIKRRPGEADGPYTGYNVSPAFAARSREVPGYGQEEYPELRVGSEGTVPDDIRIGRREPPPNSFADIWPKPGEAERQFRTQADHETTVTGWKIRQGKATPPPRVPYWEQDNMPTRPTANAAPMPYLFRRDWHIPRNVEEIYGPGAELSPGRMRRHFSLADHRRVYQIYGQQPRGGVGVNTYRKDPGPWDVRLYAPQGDYGAVPTGTGLARVAQTRPFRRR